MGNMVGVQLLAEVMNLTPRRVQQLVPEGLPKAKRGLYDEEQVLRWYCRYLQGKLNSGGTDGPKLSGRERLDDAKAGQEEIALAVALKSFAAIEDFERVWSDLITPAKLELLAIEPRLRPVIGPEAAAKCGAEVRRCLRVLGDDE